MIYTDDMDMNSEKESILEKIEGIFIISKRGRSLQLTIPIEVSEAIDLKKGDYVKFYINKKHNYAIIIDKEKLKDKIVIGKDFGFTHIQQSEHLLKSSDIAIDNKIKKNHNDKLE